MRLKIAADTLPEWLALRHPSFPRPMVEVMGGMLLSRAVMAGVRFGVFDHLEAGALNARQVAEASGCDPHAMGLLLDSLVGCGYLARTEGLYRNTPAATRWLLSGSSNTAAHFVRYNYDQWEWVNHLEEFIEHGRPRNIHQTIDTPEGWRRYLLGLRDTARISAREILSHVRKSPAPRSLLDVGAGHCHYSIALCRAHPGLSVTVADLEPSIQIGRELVSEAGLASRFTFHSGSLPGVPIGENHDAALLFNVLHHMDEGTTRETLRRISTALAPGGQLLILDEFGGEEGAPPKDQMSGLLSLFFGLVSGGRALSAATVEGWLQEAGFQRSRRVSMRTIPLASLVIAEK